MMSIEKLRLEYGNTPLLEEELHLNPIQQFLIWLKKAITAKVLEPNAAALATVTQTGRPTSRMILLKGVDQKGFTFFTHYTSRKGEHLSRYGFASLTIWWKEIYRQITIEGSVKKVSRKESLAYFQKRPRGAQLATLISHQSEPLATRLELENEFRRLKKLYHNKTIPCPKNWGGYRLVPDRIEFWQGRKNRLHDRFVYVKTNGEWILSRLFP